MFTLVTTHTSFRPSCEGSDWSKHFQAILLNETDLTCGENYYLIPRYKDNKVAFCTAQNLMPKQPKVDPEFFVEAFLGG